ncbi:hypothetical protein Ac2012v2_005797 [Leucoagaricus gongylophorus]
MQVINSHSSLLSNYEVLALLQELEHTHLERSKAAVRIKKEEQAAGAPTTHTNPIPDISQNIRTIQVEVSIPFRWKMCSGYSYMIPDNPVSHIRLPPHNLSNSKWNISTSQGHLSIRPYKGRKTPDCEFSSYNGC